MTKLQFLTVLAGSTFAFAGTAYAHTKVVASTPAANATVAQMNLISVTFDEAAVPAFSGADVVMTSMPGMAMKSPVNMTGLKSKWSADGKTLSLMARRPFPKGTYQVTWHTADADTHRMQGTFTFRVK